jgi:hypothetical protein
MTAKIIETLVMEGVALLMFWFGYMIGVKKRMELIAGYNEKTADRVVNKDGLARLIARVCYLVGIASALMPVATSLFGTTNSALMQLIGGYGGFIVGVVALTMLQARDFTK